MEFAGGDTITCLSCHERHVLHKDCYTDFLEFMKSNNKRLLCPECRAPIEESKVKENTLSLIAERPIPEKPDGTGLTGGHLKRVR